MDCLLAVAVHIVEAGRVARGIAGDRRIIDALVTGRAGCDAAHPCATDTVQHRRLTQGPERSDVTAAVDLAGFRVYDTIQADQRRKQIVHARTGPRMHRSNYRIDLLVPHNFNAVVQGIGARSAAAPRIRHPTAVLPLQPALGAAVVAAARRVGTAHLGRAQNDGADRKKHITSLIRSPPSTATRSRYPSMLPRHQDSMHGVLFFLRLRRQDPVGSAQALSTPVLGAPDFPLHLSLERPLPHDKARSCDFQALRGALPLTRWVQ